MKQQRSRTDARRRLFTSVLLMVFSASAAAMPRAFPKRVGGPAVVFETGRVRATGATPGATIHFASVSLYNADGMLHTTRTAGAAIADAAGNADFSAEVHTRSVWIVIEAGKGYTVASPPGMLLREMDFPGNANENASGQVHSMLLDRFGVEVFLVRPGEGTWTAYFRDGSARDGDGEPNGSNHADFADLAPVGATTGAAERFEPSDYLFLVDRNSLEFHVARRGAQ